MKQWVFVHNDEQVSSETLLVLEDLKKEFPKLTIGEFIKKESLWDIVVRLPGDKLRLLFPAFPEQAFFDRLGFKDLQPVLRFLERATVPLDLEITAPSPSKLAHNTVSPGSEDWLRIGRRKEHLVGQYFEGTTDPDLGEKIAEAFRQRYRQLDSAGWTSDQILMELYGFAGGFKFHDQIEQAAVLSVLAYFFERCDIFKNPPEESRP